MTLIDPTTAANILAAAALYDAGGWSDVDDYVGCECEQDWNCGLHADGPTWLESRFQGMDVEEARYYGEPF